MPLLPADFIQPSLQINLRIILDGTNKKKKVKAVAAGLLRICCTIHRERNQVEISPGKEYLALQRNMCMMRLYAVSQVPSRMPVFLYNANVFRKH